MSAGLRASVVLVEGDRHTPATVEWAPTAATLTVTKCAGSDRHRRLALHDLINSVVVVVEDGDDATVSASWVVSYAATGAMCFTAPPEVLEAVRCISDAVVRRIYPHGALHFVAFVSPVSGSGHAVKNWARYGEAVLRKSRHTFTTVTTTHKGHAEEFAATGDIGPRDVIVAVGGDGMAFEVVNGLQKRRLADGGGDSAVDLDGALPRVATFPCGSGCALAKMLGVIDFTAAAVALVHTRSEPIELMQLALTTPGVAPTQQYGFMSANFGFGADVDIVSESKRWMGNARFTVQALQMMAGKTPTYPMTIRYKPVRSAKTGAVLDSYEAIKAAELHPLTLSAEPGAVSAKSEIVFDADAEWVTVPQEEFVFLAVCNIPLLAQDMIAAPFARPADGCLDIVYSTSTVSRTRLLLSMVAMEDGSQYPHEDLKYIKCAAVEVTPSKGRVTIDGEVVQCSTVTTDMADKPLRFVKAAEPYALDKNVRGSFDKN
jgi:sphingosine kinase